VRGALSSIMGRAVYSISICCLYSSIQFWWDL